MKKTICAIISIVLIVSLVGCASPKNTSTTKKEDTKFKVALLVPGSINDNGWNASAYAGLKLIEKELGAEISYVEAGNPTDMKTSFRDYADSGNNLIIGHGYQYQDAALEVSKDYPKTYFVSIGGNKTSANCVPAVMRLEEVSYLSGMISATLTKTKKIGFIGAMDSPAITKGFRAFEMGIKSIDPSITVMTTYVGSWDDVNAGYEAALNQINKGADILAPNGNAVNLGVLKATNEKKVMSWGSINDQSSLSPDYMIGSDITYVDKLYLSIAKVVKDKKFIGNTQLSAGIKEGVVEMKLNPKFKGKISDEILAKAEQAKNDILSGKLVIPGENDK